jgi:hypothetical protein
MLVTKIGIHIVWKKILKRRWHACSHSEKIVDVCLWLSRHYQSITSCHKLTFFVITMKRAANSTSQITKKKTVSTIIAMKAQSMQIL